MPFAVFRRHQRKMLAIFAILAMFGFVVADSLPRLLSGSPTAGANPVVVELYGRSVRRSELDILAAERSNANLFMGQLTALLTNGMRSNPQFFGELNTRSMVDSLILLKEADRLGMPRGAEAGREWLKKFSNNLMTRDLFEAILSRFNNRVSGEQILDSIANQVRIANVRYLLGAPVVTPLDVFDIYRDQNERVSTRVVAFKVEDFLTKVAEPTQAETQAYYDKYKNDLPNPERPAPGFKVPRQIQVEILSIDGEAVARGIKDKLTDSELQTYYENRKSEFKKPSELPDDLFQDRPDLTPPQVQAFSEVRPYLATSLAEERAQAEIVAKFDRIKEDVLIPFTDKYFEAADEIAETQKQGGTPKVVLPKPTLLKEVAAKEGLEYDLTDPPLSRDRAEKYGLISGAEAGLTRFSGGKKFADELFDSKSSLYESTDFTDAGGRRYLVRKLQDLAPRVPALDEVRSAVVLAWKTEQARVPTEKAARELSEKVKADKGKFAAEIVDGRPVITTDPVTKLRPGGLNPMTMMDFGPPTPSSIPQLTLPGNELREAYFGLHEGDVAVAPNEPKTVFYVLTLNRRIPATFSVLYAPNGDYFRYRSEAFTDAFRAREKAWLEQLRLKAGLSADWSPKDEAKTSADEA